MEYDSDKWIRNIKDEPILIFHAIDDGTVPYKLGKSSNNMTLYTFT